MKGDLRRVFFEPPMSNEVLTKFIYPTVSSKQPSKKSKTYNEHIWSQVNILFIADTRWIHILFGVFARFMETATHRMLLLQYNSGVYIQMKMNLNFLRKLSFNKSFRIALFPSTHF